MCFQNFDIDIALYFDTSHDDGRQIGPTTGPTASFSLKMASQPKVAALRYYAFWLVCKHFHMKLFGFILQNIWLFNVMSS